MAQPSRQIRRYLIACAAVMAFCLLAWLYLSDEGSPSLMTRLQHSLTVDTIHFSKSAEHVMCVSEEVSVFELGRDGRRPLLHVGELFGHPTSSAAFLGDGSAVVVGFKQGDVHLFDIGNDGQTRELVAASDDPVIGLVEGQSGQTIAALTAAGRLLLLDVSDGRIVWEMDNVASQVGTRLVVMLEEGRKLATCLSASEHGEFRSSLVVLDCESGVVVSEAAVPSGDVHSLAYNAEAGILYAGADDGSIWLWDTASTSEPSRVTGHTTAVTHLLLDRQYRRLISVSGEEGLAKKWAVHHESGDLTFATDLWNKDDVDVVSESVSIGGGVVSIGYIYRNVIRDWECRVDIIDIRSGERICRAEPTISMLRSAALSNDGRLLATGTSWTFAEVWRLPTPAEHE